MPHPCLTQAGPGFRFSGSRWRRLAAFMAAVDGYRGSDDRARWHVAMMGSPESSRGRKARASRSATWAERSSSRPTLPGLRHWPATSLHSPRRAHRTVPISTWRSTTDSKRAPWAWSWRDATTNDSCQTRARSCGEPRGTAGNQPTVHQASAPLHRRSGPEQALDALSFPS